MNEKKQDIVASARIHWIDMARGYGMIAVILAHLGIGPWFYSFHIPLFFWVSGYLFNSRDDFKTFLKKKTRSLLIPYFSLGLVICIYQMIVNQSNLIQSIHIIGAFILQIRNGTLWFLACLFLVELIAFALIRFSGSKKTLVFYVLSIFLLGLIYNETINTPLPWNIDVCPMALPFFFCGYAFKHSAGKLKSRLSYTPIPLIIICSLAINIHLYIFGARLEMYGSIYKYPLLAYICALSGIVFICTFSKCYSIPFIEYIGRNTLLYFAWHNNLIIPLIYTLFRNNGWLVNTETPLFYCQRLSWFVLTIAILSVLNVTISKSRFKFIIGKYEKTLLS